MYKHRLIIVVCVLLIVGLVCAPFSTPARAIVGIDDALAGGLFMAFFEAMGLSFTFTGIDQTKEGLLEFIQDQYDLYCIHKGVVKTLISDAWSALTDAIFTGGTIKIPKAAADDMGEFASWIVDEYNVSDNTSSVISSQNGYYLSDGSEIHYNELFEPNQTIYFSNGNSLTLNVYSQNGSNYFYFNYVKNGILYRVPGTQWATTWNVDGFFWSNSINVSGKTPLFDSDYIGIQISRNGSINNRVESFITGSLSSLTDISSEQISVDSDVINLPGEIPEDDDIYVTVPGITDVFGGTVEGAADQVLTEALEGDLTSSYEMTDTAPTYPDPSGPTATNIYGITFPSSPFGGIWHYVTELVEAVSGYVLAITSVWAILPSALMLPLYAGTVLVLVLGGFKVFRGVH